MGPGLQTAAPVATLAARHAVVAGQAWKGRSPTGSATRDPAAGRADDRRCRSFEHATGNPLRPACDAFPDSLCLAVGTLVRLAVVSVPHDHNGRIAVWMLCSVRYHPQHLAYFNELAGSPTGGRRHLLDSNLDWGQDLGSLADFLRERRLDSSREHRLDEIGLAYFGTVPPAALGIAYHIPPSRTPKPGRFAVSVNFEQGMPHWVRTPDNEIRPVDINEFSYFRSFQPIAHVGASIDIFDLSPDEIARWRAAAPGMQR